MIMLMRRDDKHREKFNILQKVKTKKVIHLSQNEAGKTKDMVKGKDEE